MDLQLNFGYAKPGRRRVSNDVRLALAALTPLTPTLSHKGRGRKREPLPQEAREEKKLRSA